MFRVLSQCFLASVKNKGLVALFKVLLEHVFVVSYKENRRDLGLKFTQKADDFSAVWASVNVISKENEGVVTAWLNFF